MDAVATIKLFGGLTYLLIAGDLLVRAALSLSRQARIPPMIVGLTVVALGTSTPELFVSVRAAMQGLPGIALGNVIGSNIVNVLLVLGLPALIHAMRSSQPSASRDGSLMLGVSVLFAATCAMGDLGSKQGVSFLLVLGIYLVLVARSGRLEVDELDTKVDRVLGLPSQKHMIALFFVIGLAGLQLGAKLTIDGAVAVAARAGVPDTVVALTVIALGTSLPELATTMIAAFQRESDVAIGNVLGSCVFNLLAIMGLSSLLAPHPIPVPEAVIRFDLPMMVGSALVLAVFTWTGRPIGFRAGVLLLTGYVAYVGALISQRSV
jgi:cation:H+ antiporter